MLKSIKHDSHPLSVEAFGNSQPKFHTEILKKIRRMAEGDNHPPETSDGANVQLTVRQTLEAFQRDIIQRNIWIRIYDDHVSPLPTFSSEACYAIEEIIRNALQRHRSSKMIAYVEISFSANEIGTVVSIEDNADSLSSEEVADLPFLRVCSTNVLPGGYTVQAEMNGAPGEISVRCVNNCFTRFGICLPY